MCHYVHIGHVETSGALVLKCAEQLGIEKVSNQKSNTLTIEGDRIDPLPDSQFDIPPIDAATLASTEGRIGFFANLANYAKERHGWTVKQICEATGTSERHYFKIRNGEEGKAPSLKTIVKLWSKVTDRPESDLAITNLTANEFRPKVKAVVTGILNRIAAIDSEDEQLTVLQQVDGILAAWEKLSKARYQAVPQADAGLINFFDEWIAGAEVNLMSENPFTETIGSVMNSVPAKERAGIAWACLNLATKLPTALKEKQQLKVAICKIVKDVLIDRGYLTERPARPQPARPFLPPTENDLAKWKSKIPGGDPNEHYPTS